MNTTIEIKKALSQYGLTDEQISVYLCLVENGDSKPFPISRLTQVPRTTVYRLLDELRNLGIVTIFKKNNINYYSAENPKRLIDRLKEKENIIKEIIPSIESLFDKKEDSSGVRIYTGDNGAKIGLDFLYDYLEKKSIKQIYTYSDVSIAKHLPKYLDTIIEKREKLGIKVKMIVSENIKNESSLYKKHYIPNDKREVRWLPYKFLFNGTMIIGGTMAVCFSLKDKQLHTIVLESESIIQMFTQFFLYTWETLESKD